MALAWALGQTPLADSYNLANTTPNMLYDIVLGGILSATFIPVFVDRLSNKSEREAFDSISAVLTVSVVVLLTTTLAALVAAPFIIDALTLLDTHSGPDQIHRVLLERQVATGFLRWFVIQFAAYGLFALAAALLYARRRFIAVAWAPIVNNVLCIGMLIWFGLWTSNRASLASVEDHRSQLVLLGLGTSLGVVLQGVALIPSLRRADLGRLRWNWNPRDEALRAVTRLGGWTFGFVLANQLALFVVTILAGSVPGADPVSSYTYAYAFFQLPYGVVAVTVMSVVTPDLAERWSTGQRTAFLKRMTGGLRAVLALIIPSAIGMLLLARPAVALLLGIGHSTPAETATTGAALAMFALGLPGFCLPLLRAGPAVDAADQVRLLPLPRGERPEHCPGAASGASAGRARARAVALHRLHGVGAPGAGPVPPVVRAPGRARTWAPLVRVLIASVPMAIVVLVVSNLSASTSLTGLLARVVGSVVAGGLTFGAVVIWLGRRHDTHRRPPSRPVGPVGPEDPDTPRGPVRPTGPRGATTGRIVTAGRFRPPAPGASSETLPRLA